MPALRGKFMPEQPLLFFPQRKFTLVHRRGGGRKNLAMPSPEKQRDRLIPKMAALESSFPHLQDHPDGIFPEQALVLETVDSVNEFYKALKGLELEWIGEYDVEDIEPDEDFFDPKQRQAQLPGRLYLIFQNHRGLQQLLSLWRAFAKDPSHIKFDRGRAKFARLFKQLKDIHPWGHLDRLRETGLLEDWEERAREGQETMRLELELWPHKNPGRRKKVERWIEDLTRQQQGRVLGSWDATVDYAYHAMLVELPIQSVQRILDDPNVGLARCQEIMFFRPTGQISDPLAPEPFQALISASSLPPAEGTPIAALLDGLPLVKHRCLDDRLIVDDPDRWEDEYPFADRKHGTAMASLILHGELDAQEAPLRHPLYVRPVMKPDPRSRERTECIPDDSLVVDLIQRAVTRISAGEGADPPVAPEVRIINLSLGDRWRPFDRFPSPWARMLDFLAVKHNILFVVSAGNHNGSLELDIPKDELPQLLADQERLRSAALHANLSETRHRRILSPAEAINAITVGSLNNDRSPGSSQGIDPWKNSSLPSLFSAHGPGFRRSVKPEILFSGGRSLFRESYGSGDRAVLEPISGSRSSGHKVAAPGVQPGDLSHVRYARGTSNAAALVTRTACQLYEKLTELREELGDLGPPSENIPVLLRALLVHGASWGEDRVEEFARSFGSSRRKEVASRFLGYGVLEPSRVLGCTDQRVTVLGWGELGPGIAYGYTLPLPPSLNGLPVHRRLITTLAWFSPIHSRDHRYRGAALWLDAFDSSRGPGQPDEAAALLGLKRVETGHKESRRGTVQHEIWSGEKATSYEEEELLHLQVNCQEDAEKQGRWLSRPVRYGLAVTLEVEETTGLPIYEEIQERLRLRPPVRPGIRP